MAKSTSTIIKTLQGKTQEVTPEDLALLRERSGISSKVLDDIEKANQELVISTDHFKAILGFLQGYDDFVIDISHKLQDIHKSLQGQGSEYRTVRDLSREVVTLQDKFVELSYKSFDTTRLTDYDRLLNQASKDLIKLKDLSNIESERDKIGEENLNFQINAVNTLIDRVTELKNAWKKYDEEETERRKKKARAFPASALVGGIGTIFNKIPGLELLGKDIKDRLEEALEKVADSDMGFGKANLEALKVVETVMKGRMGLIAWNTFLYLAGKALSAMWRAFKDVNAAAVELQHEIGTVSIKASVTNDAFATSVGWLKTASAIAQEFHINPQVLFSTDEIAKMAEAKNLLGLTDVEAAQLGLRVKTLGTTMEGYDKAVESSYRSILETNNIEGSHYKTAVNLMDVYKDVAKTSNTLVLSMKNNGDAIVKAVTQAKTLGMELKDIDGIASNLISFESSISAEMEAQLLTGQRLNLAQARQYALANDYNRLMNELVNQNITVESYMNMNRIQQESIAKALGMSKDRMADMMFQQIKSKGYSDEQLANLMHITVEEARAMSMTDKWNLAVQKLAQAFAPILAYVGDVVNKISDIIVGFTGFITGPVKTVQSWLGKSTESAPSIKQNASAPGSGLIAGTLLVGGTFKLGKNIGSKLGIIGKATDAANKASTVKSGGLTRLGRGINGFFTNLGKNAGTILKGIGVAAALTVVIGGLGLAFQTFTKLDWKTLGIAGTALFGLVGAVAAIGYLSTALASSLPGIVIFAGALTLLGLSIGTLTGPLSSLAESLSTINRSFKDMPSWGTSVRELATDIDELNDSLDNLNVSRLKNLGEISSKGVRVQREETQKTTISLEQVERKLDALIGVVENIKPDWDWVKFDQAYARNIAR